MPSTDRYRYKINLTNSNPIPARYIRVQILNTNAIQAMGLAEMEVYGNQYLSPEPEISWGYEEGNPQLPVISFVAASGVYDVSATITWLTDRPSDSVVKYGTSTGVYNFVESNGTLATSHIIRLTGLNPATKYYYIVNSTDQFGNSNESVEYNFTTKEQETAYIKTFNVLENVTKISCTVLWIGFYDSSGVSLTLISPSNDYYTEFGSGVITRKKLTETIIPLPALQDYNVTRYDGVTRMTISSPAQGMWTLKVVDTNVTSFEADYEMS